MSVHPFVRLLPAAREQRTFIRVLAVVTSPMRVGRLAQLAALGTRSRRSPSLRHLVQRSVRMLARVLAVSARAGVARVLQATPINQYLRSCPSYRVLLTFTPSMSIASLLFGEIEVRPSCRQSNNPARAGPRAGPYDLLQ